MKAIDTARPRLRIQAGRPPRAAARELAKRLYTLGVLPAPERVTEFTLTGLGDGEGATVVVEATIRVRVDRGLADLIRRDVVDCGFELEPPTDGREVRREWH